MSNDHQGQALARRRQALNLTQQQLGDISQLGKNAVAGAETVPGYSKHHAPIAAALSQLEAEAFGELTEDPAMGQIRQLANELAAVAQDPKRMHLFWADLLEYAQLNTARLKKKYGGPV